MEKYYKQLHENPELSGMEYKTNKFILEVLSKYNIKVYKINLSIIAFFNKNKKETLAFRSEMDALPISESLSHKISSKNDCMHACGHDIHTSALLKLSSYIFNNDFTENIALIFQSKEETGLGSKDIVKSNIFNKLNITKVIGVHVWPNIEENKLFSNRNLFYGSFELDVNVWGKSNHVSSYNKYTDATHASFLIYNRLRKMKKNKIAHLGKLSSGIIRNISSEHAVLNYSIRFKKYHNIDTKIKKKKIKSDCMIDYNFKEYYPPLICDYELLNKINHNKIKTQLAAEDFGYYSEKSKIIFLLYGLGKGYNLHTNQFKTSELQRENYYNKVKEIINYFKIDK